MHKADGALLHARAARSGDDDQRLARSDGPFDGARDFLAHYAAQAAANELRLHGADLHFTAVDGAGGGDQRVGKRCSLLRGGQALAIGALVHELQRVGRGQFSIKLLVRAVENQFQPRYGVNPKMRAALRAHTVALFEVLLPDDLFAAFALLPETFGFDLPLAVAGLRLFSLGAAAFPLEPGHEPTYLSAGTDDPATW